MPRPLLRLLPPNAYTHAPLKYVSLWTDFQTAPQLSMDDADPARLKQVKKIEIIIN